MCFTRHVSLSSDGSSPSPACVCSSEGTQSKTFPSSPADANISPASVRLVFRARIWKDILFGLNRTTFTACVCLMSVLRYDILRSSPVDSTFQSCITCQIKVDKGRGRFRTRTLLSLTIRSVGIVNSKGTKRTYFPAVASLPLPLGSK